MRLDQNALSQANHERITSCLAILGIKRGISVCPRKKKGVTWNFDRRISRSLRMNDGGEPGEM